MKDYRKPPIYQFFEILIIRMFKVISSPNLVFHVVIGINVWVFDFLLLTLGSPTWGRERI